MKEGQELIVQVDKEERGTKGAAPTTFISFAATWCSCRTTARRHLPSYRRGREDQLRDAMKSLTTKTAWA